MASRQSSKCKGGGRPKWPWPKPKEKEGGGTKPLFSEHSLPPDQLADIFPLARIDAPNLMASRGISQEEARLRLAESRRLDGLRRLSSPSLAKSLSVHFHLLLRPFHLPLLISSLLFLFFSLLPSKNVPPSFFPSPPLLVFLLQFAFLSFSIFLSAYQKWKAKRAEGAFLGLKSPSDQIFTAIREGKEAKIKAKDILAGELLLVKAGQRMAADVRILKIVEGPLMVDCVWLNAPSNGEALELTDSTAPKHLDVFQARNVLFAGSLCSQGNALGLAIRTGKQTLLSRLIARPNGLPPAPSPPPIRREFQKLLRICLFLSVCLSLLPFLLFLSFSPPSDFFAIFLHFLLLPFIGLLPHSLPIAWNANLLWNLRQFRQKCGGMVLRDVEAADQIGATKILMFHSPAAVLCANRPPVLTDFWLASTNRRIETSKMVEWAVGERQRRGKTATIGPMEMGQEFGAEAVEMMRAAAFCCRNGGKRKEERGEMTKIRMPEGEMGGRNPWIWHSFRTKVAPEKEAALDPKIGELGHRQLGESATKFGANPNDEALLKFFEQIMPIELLKEGAELLALEGPNSPLAASPDWRTPLLAFLEEEGEGEGKCRVIARGPPEELLRICSTVREADEEEGECGELPLTEEHLLQFEQQFLRLSAQSKRCLALAVLDLPDHFDFSSSTAAIPPFSRSSSPSQSALSSAEDWRSDLTGQPGEWTFLGLLAFSEFPNADCGQRMAQLEAEGIRAVLVSDEHPAVVQALAKMSGMDGQKGGRGTNGGQREGAKGKWTRRIRSPFPRLQKSHSNSNCSSGYHSTEMEAKAKSREGDGEEEEGWPIEGESMAEMNSDYLDRLVGGTGHLAFSRLDSSQIVHLIRLFQAKGLSVTFVGQNGLSDGLALRQADFGIVGSNPSLPGSLLAQHSADALCPNLQLANLQKTIRQGRTFRRNLASIAAFSLSHFPALVLPFILTSIFGLPPALSPLQVLSISFLFVIFPSIGLLLSPPPSNPLPSPSSPHFPLFLPPFVHSLLLSGSITALGSLFAFLTVFWNAGLGIGHLFGPTSHPNATISPVDSLISAKAAAAWQIAFVGSQQFNVWFCAGILANGFRRFDPSIFRRNIALWLAILLNLLLLISVVYLPGLNSIFGIRPPPAHIWLFPLAISFALFAFNLAFPPSMFCASIPHSPNQLNENAKKKKSKWSQIC